MSSYYYDEDEEYWEEDGIMPLTVIEVMSYEFENNFYNRLKKKRTVKTPEKPRPTPSPKLKKDRPKKAVSRSTPDITRKSHGSFGDDEADEEHPKKPDNNNIDIKESSPLRYGVSIPPKESPTRLQAEMEKFKSKETKVNKKENTALENFIKRETPQYIMYPFSPQPVHSFKIEMSSSPPLTNIFDFNSMKSTQKPNTPKAFVFPLARSSSSVSNKNDESIIITTTATPMKEERPVNPQTKEDSIAFHTIYKVVDGNNISVSLNYSKDKPLPAGYIADVSLDNNNNNSQKDTSSQSDMFMQFRSINSNNNNNNNHTNSLHSFSVPNFRSDNSIKHDGNQRICYSQGIPTSTPSNSDPTSLLTQPSPLPSAYNEPATENNDIVLCIEEDEIKNPPLEVVEVKDRWNRLYLGALESLLLQPSVSTEEKLLKYDKLANIIHDFTFAATTYGKIIINEYNLPDSKKTIKPTLLGGMAGGIKYIVHDILFKFSIQDKNAAISPNSFIAADEVYMKIANQELKCLDNIINCKIEDLNFPLLSIIDYKGFRIIAESILPIDKSTIISGSHNGGTNYKAPTGTLRNQLEKMCTSLNLKVHDVQQKQVFGPFDLEGHEGKDGKLYLIDFSRLFPPDYISEKYLSTEIYRQLIDDRGRKIADSKNFDESDVSSHFEHHFLQFYIRPELVKKWGIMEKISLCSNTFSNFLKNDSKFNHYIQDIRQVHEHLLYEIIPKLSKVLAKYPPCSINLLLQTIHREGINYRYMSVIYYHLKHIQPVSKSSKFFETKLLVEMIARTIKWFIKKELRNTSSKLSSELPNEIPFFQCLIDQLNAIFSYPSYNYWDDESLNYHSPDDHKDVDHDYNFQFNDIIDDSNDPHYHRPSKTNPQRAWRDNNESSALQRHREIWRRIYSKFLVKFHQSHHVAFQGASTPTSTPTPIKRNRDQLLPVSPSLTKSLPIVGSNRSDKIETDDHDDDEGDDDGDDDDDLKETIIPVISFSQLLSIFFPLNQESNDNNDDGDGNGNQSDDLTYSTTSNDENIENIPNNHQTKNNIRRSTKRSTNPPSSSSSSSSSSSKQPAFVLCELLKRVVELVGIQFNPSVLNYFLSSLAPFHSASPFKILHITDMKVIAKNISFFEIIFANISLLPTHLPPLCHHSIPLKFLRFISIFKAEHQNELQNRVFMNSPHRPEENDDLIPNLFSPNSGGSNSNDPDKKDILNDEYLRSFERFLNEHYVKPSASASSSSLPSSFSSSSEKNKYYYYQGAKNERYEREEYKQLLKLSLSHFEKALRTNPSCSLALFGAAKIYAKLHHFEKAKNYFLILLSSNPDKVGSSASNNNNNNNNNSGNNNINIIDNNHYNEIINPNYNNNNYNNNNNNNNNNIKNNNRGCGFDDDIAIEWGRKENHYIYLFNFAKFLHLQYSTQCNNNKDSRGRKYVLKQAVRYYLQSAAHAPPHHRWKIICYYCHNLLILNREKSVIIKNFENAQADAPADSILHPLYCYLLHYCTSK